MAVKIPSAFKSPTGRLVLAITMTDLFDCTTKFIGQWGPMSGVDGILCQYQTWSITHFNISSVLLGMIMGFNAMYLIYFNGTVEKIQKYEWLMIAICFLFPLPFSLAPLFLKPLGVNMYGDANMWCWITAEHGVYRIYFWFSILWIVSIINIFTLTLTVMEIRKNQGYLKNLSAAFKPKTKEEDLAAKGKTFGNFITKRMMAYLIAFFLVWTPSSVNRVYGLFVGEPSFVLNLAQSICSPSRGFINFIVFFYSWFYYV